MADPKGRICRCVVVQPVLLVLLVLLQVLSACSAVSPVSMKGGAAESESLGEPQPRLVVQITVDQLRGDLPMRYRERLGEGGFRYLLEQGLHYTNAHYRHANTEEAGRFSFDYFKKSDSPIHRAVERRFGRSDLIVDHSHPYLIPERGCDSTGSARPGGGRALRGGRGDPGAGCLLGTRQQ